MGVNDFQFLLRKMSHLILPQEINNGYTLQEINNAVTFERQCFKVVRPIGHRPICAPYTSLLSLF